MLSWAGFREGEKVCLAVLAPDGQRPESDTLLRHLYESGLSKYDMPEYYIQVDAFPLTASGKILKRELVAMVERGALSPEPIRFAAPD